MLYRGVGLATHSRLFVIAHSPSGSVDISGIGAEAIHLRLISASLARGLLVPGLAGSFRFRRTGLGRSGFHRFRQDEGTGLGGRGCRRRLRTLTGLLEFQYLRRTQ